MHPSIKLLMHWFPINTGYWSENAKFNDILRFVLTLSSTVRYLRDLDNLRLLLLLRKYHICFTITMPILYCTKNDIKTKIDKNLHTVDNATYIMLNDTIIRIQMQKVKIKFWRW